MPDTANHIPNEWQSFKTEVLLRLQSMSATQAQFQIDLHKIADENARMNKSLERVLMGDGTDEHAGLVNRTAVVEATVDGIVKMQDELRGDYFGDNIKRGNRDKIVLIWNAYIWIACTLSAGMGVASTLIIERFIK